MDASHSQANPFMTPQQEATSAEEPVEVTAMSAEIVDDEELSQETAASLLSEHEALKQKHADLNDQFLRLAADFENFRKRRNEEMAQNRKYGAEPVLTELIPVLDNLDRAQKSLKEDSDPKVLFQSLSLMRNQLQETLELVGLKRMQVLGQPFDHTRHEAISRQEDASQPEETVVAEQQAGFMLHDKVIRPAMVVVSSRPSA